MSIVTYVTRRYTNTTGELIYIDSSATNTPDVSFAFDALGRRTPRIDAASIANQFGYNDRSELTAALMGTNQYGYAYDDMGRRYRKTVAGVGDPGSDLHETAANRILHETKPSKNPGRRRWK